jgi:hypothetical protein
MSLTMFRLGELGYAEGLEIGEIENATFFFAEVLSGFNQNLLGPILFSHYFFKKKENWLLSLLLLKFFFHRTKSSKYNR